ncbi:MAG: hypothetical protein RID81_07045 [Sandaracinaceae bacterium]
MRRQIVASIRAGEGVIRTAERLLDLDNPTVRMPEHVRALRDAAKAGPRELRAEVARWRGRVARLGQGPGRKAGAYTVRSATQHLIKRIRGRVHPGQIDRAVQRWALDRARYQARLVARTETKQAYSRAYHESTRRQTFVKGYRWTLSSAHERDDDCDVLAEQSVSNLGPGGYPSSDIPVPPHPGDLCYLVAIVDPDHFERVRASEAGEPEPPRGWERGEPQSGADWLRAQPRARQVSILGPTRARILREHPERVVRPDGSIRPVWEAMGLRGPPHRRPGPPLPARPLIRADRASMVEPFPAAPRLAAGDDGRQRS